MAKKGHCFICAGYDPKCDCHHRKRREKREKEAAKEREKFLATLWLNAWQFATIINQPALLEAADKFGLWMDDKGQRNPIPEDVKRLAK